MRERVSADPGVLFRRDDCASVWRRVVAWILDGVILIVAVTLAEYVWWFVLAGLEITTLFSIGSSALLWTLYLGPLKRSAWRTVGYRVAGLRIVSLSGNPPGLWALFLRSTMAALWTLSCSTLLFVDLFWIGQDDQRQTLRDKIAGTVVVRADAAPIATGVQAMRIYSFAGWTLYLREVKKVAPPS